MVRIASLPTPRERLNHSLSRILGRGNERRFIVLLLLLTLAKGFLFAAIVPKWQAPDEPSYFKYTKILVEQKRAPLATETPAAGHPPLFPILSAVPYVLAKPLGHTGQVFSIRLLSVLFSAAVVWLGFKTAAAIFPEKKFVQVLAPTLIAFSPQYSFISSSINSDALLILVLALAVYQLVLAINSPLTWKGFTFLMLTVSVGLLTKERFLVILPSLFLVIAYDLYRKIRSKYPNFLGKKTNLALLIAGVYLFFALRWWTKLNLGLQIGERVARALPYYTPSSLKELFLSRNFPERTFEGFWGQFGWLSIHMRQEIYFIIELITISSLVGLAIWLGKNLWYHFSGKESPGIQRFSGKQSFALGVFVLTIYLALYATATYDLVTGGGQGRYMLAVVVPLFLLLSLGLENLFPAKARWEALVLLFLASFALNAISLFYTILPWYYR